DGAERRHVQLSRAEELAISSRAGVDDGSTSVSTDDEDERPHGENRQCESRGRSKAGLHAPFFGGTTGEAPSLVRGTKRGTRRLSPNPRGAGVNLRASTPGRSRGHCPRLLYARIASDARDASGAQRRQQVPAQPSGSS